MPKPTILKLAGQIHSDITTASPNGRTIPRQTFLSILVQAYKATSLEAAERVVKTGEAAGYWTRRHDPKARMAFITVKPSTIPGPDPAKGS